METCLVYIYIKQQEKEEVVESVFTKDWWGDLITEDWWSDMSSQEQEDYIKKVY